MPTLDIFNNDAFSVTNLTKAINDTPHKPGRIGQLGWFTEEGITTTAAMIERQGNQLKLVPTAARGSTGQATSRDKRKLIPIGTTHLPQRDAVMADEVQNVRAFGSETEVETVQNIVNKRLAKMRNNIDVTMEFQRIGAMKGLVVDADGTSPILDLFQTFGLTQVVKNMNLNVDATKVRTEVVDFKRTVENGLGALPYSNLRVMCSAGFFDAFVDHPAVQKAWDNFQDRGNLQKDLRGGFYFANVFWEEYRGKIGSIDFIEDGAAYVVPEGVPDLFTTYFAPADYMETVNTIGLPYYAKQQLMDFNKGAEIETQSNPICICTRPDAIVKLLAE